MLARKFHSQQLSFTSHYTSRAKIPSSFYKGVVKREVFVKSLWSLLRSLGYLFSLLLLWRYLFGRGNCKRWSSVLRSSVDHCKVLKNSGNPSRRWRRGVERWLEPRNKLLVFAIVLRSYLLSISLALYCFLLFACDLVSLYLWYIVCTSLLHS